MTFKKSTISKRRENKIKDEYVYTIRFDRVHLCRHIIFMYSHILKKRRANASDAPLKAKLTSLTCLPNSQFNSTFATSTAQDK